jgi:hypothetical protein
MRRTAPLEPGLVNLHQQRAKRPNVHVALKLVAGHALAEYLALVGRLARVGVGGNVAHLHRLAPRSRARLETRRVRIKFAQDHVAQHPLHRQTPTPDPNASPPR